MKQVITAKLKLKLTSEQKQSVRQTTLAYRDAMNYASQVAFVNNKLSSAAKLQKLVYYDIREKFNLPAQMSCNVSRQVAVTYKSLWTKVKQNVNNIKKGYAKKRYKGLDQAPKFISRTTTLNYQRDYSFKVNRAVSLNTFRWSDCCTLRWL